MSRISRDSLTDLTYELLIVTKFKRKLFTSTVAEVCIHQGLSQTCAFLNAQVNAIDIGPEWVRVQFSLPPDVAPGKLPWHLYKTIGNAYRATFPGAIPETSPIFSSNYVLNSLGENGISQKEQEDFIASIVSNKRIRPAIEFRS